MSILTSVYGLKLQVLGKFFGALPEICISDYIPKGQDFLQKHI